MFSLTEKDNMSTVIQLESSDGSSKIQMSTEQYQYGKMVYVTLVVVLVVVIILLVIWIIWRATTGSTTTSGCPENSGMYDYRYSAVGQSSQGLVSQNNGLALPTPEECREDGRGYWDTKKTAVDVHRPGTVRTAKNRRTRMTTTPSVRVMR